MKKAVLASLVSILILSSFGVVVYAQVGGQGSTGGVSGSGQTGGVSGTGSTGGVSGTGSTGGGAITLDNPFGETGGSLTGLLEAIFNDIIFPIGGILAVLAFIYSGFLFVKAQGNESDLKTAKNALLYSAIGTAILLGARVIAEVIGNTVNQLK